MPAPTKGPRLGGGPAHERLMLNNMAAALFEHKRITTTVTKAKRLRPVAERLITFAKRGDLASRRRVQAAISARTNTNKGIIHELFTEIAPQLAERNGGYTRITKIGNRKGDNAPMAVIELVLEPVSAKQAVVKEAEKATSKAAPAAEAPAETPAEAEVVEETQAEETPAEAEAAEAPEAEAAEAPAEEKKADDAK
ncbi:50S ribosomal protein L17 [Sinomonas sp. R1AF57]|jgi:large subunit ribosomal protein L17|uniref:50S ribosomal protein L17 n=1 Tax=Sinomonas sp. R1AF57 TaxID=2020377 RepID=UPI000B5DDB17|nr:50S ribosomal protein L17 [Sinomonas sp. R1AF57]ASN52658.1 50S ribosomal protein L17 [Sinomonas sp. R1AF57]